MKLPKEMVMPIILSGKRASDPDRSEGKEALREDMKVRFNTLWEILEWSTCISTNL